MCRDLVCCGASNLLPEESAEITDLAKYRAVTYVKYLGEGLDVKKPSGQLQVGVDDPAFRVGFGDKEVGNALGAAEAPHNRLAGGPFLRREVSGREPDAT